MRESIPASREVLLVSRDEKIISFPHELCLARYQLLDQKVSTGFIATQVKVASFTS